MDDELRQHLRELLKLYTRRLRVLEVIQARSGDNTPPGIILEIEDIRAQISRLEDQLALLVQSDSASTPDDTKPKPRSTQTLPEPVADFVGRSREISYLTKALGRTAKHGKVVSICGMGGVGKTQLAYAAAQRLTQQFHDGQFSVKLRGTSGEPLTAMQGLQQILRTIAPEITLPNDLPELQDEYRRRLVGKHVLILADDAAGAQQVQRLVPPAGCALLITSRHHFTLPGLLAFNLDVLRQEDAIKLLLAICNRLNGYAARLAELCGYLPQALRIVASMLANDVTTDIEQFLDGWTNRSPIQEIEMSLALSYDALDSNSQSTLRQLSIFLVSFDLAAARAVVRGVDDVAEPLSRLVQRSLLIWQEGTKRYDFHQLTRSFAAARLDEAEETAGRSRHAQYYLTIAETAALMLQGKRQRRELDHLENEHDQLRAALRWAFDRKDATLSARFTGALWRFWWMRGFVSEGRERLEKALSLEGDIAPAIRAEALNGAGVLAHAQGDYLTATKRCLQSLRLAKQSGDKAQIAATYISLGMIAVDQGRYNRGRKLLEASVKLCHKLEHGWLHAWATHNLGLAMLAQGFFAVAEELFQESLTLCQNLADPDPWLMSRSLNILGRVAGDRGNYEQAVQILHESLELCKMLGDKVGCAYALYSLGKAAYRQGEYQLALAYNIERLSIEARMKNKQGVASADSWLGWIRVALGEYAQAEVDLQRSLTGYQELGDLPNIAHAIAWLGVLACVQGDYQRAGEYLQQSLDLSERQRDQLGISYARLGLGELTYRQGDYKTALEHNQARLSIEQKLGNKQGIAHAISWLGWILSAQGEYVQGVRLLKESRARYEEINDWQGVAQTLRWLGIIANDQQNYFDAVNQLNKSLAIYQQMQVKPGWAQTLRWLGVVAIERCEYEQAECHLQESLTLYSEQHVSVGCAHAHRWLGVVARERSNHPAASSHLHESLKLYQTMNLKPAMVTALEEVAQLAALRGEALLSTQLFAAAVNQRTTIGLRRLAVHLYTHTHRIAAVREMLDDSSFTDAWSEGQKMDLDQALGYALSYTLTR